MMTVSTQYAAALCTDVAIYIVDICFFFCIYKGVIVNIVIRKF